MSGIKWWQRRGFRTGHLPTRKAVSSRIMALEPRFMFDAAGAATADGVAHTDMALADIDHGAPAADPAFLDALAQSVPVAAGRPDVVPAPASAVETSATPASVSAPASDGSGGHTVMFVDRTIADYQTLVDGALPGVEVVVLDPTRDGLVQMADYLNGRSGIDSIQIMAHGSAGRFALAGIDVNADTLATHGAELAAIGRALTQDGDILIYACNTGAGIDGQAFVVDLAMATGADVAASSDNTGAAALGGNWVLEARAGAIEATAALTAAAQDSYDALMTATFTLESGSANAVSALGTVGTTKSFIAADFDGDGDVDFIVRNNSASPTGVDFWRNDDGVFTRFSGAVTGNPFSAITWSGPNSAVLAANFTPFSMLATDVDGDGDIDVVNMASGVARGIWLNDSGVFSRSTASPTLPTITANTQSGAGDFDGDGDIDVIARNNTAAPTGVNFWRNDGGTFTLVSSNASNNPFSSVTFAALAASFDARFMGAGDVDGDGDIDIVNMTSANGRGVWLNNSGVFAIASAGCLPVGTTSGQFVAGDFDGDGDTDIAFRNASGTAIDFYRASGGTFTLDNSGSPFSAIAFSGGGTNNNFNSDLMVATDIDGDSDLDIANFTSTPGRGTFRNNLTPPQLTSVLVGGVTVDEVDNPSGAGTTPTITLTFSKTIQSAGAGKIYIREYGTDTLVGTAVTATDTAKVSGVGSGSTITIDPGVTLSSGTRYYIEIDKGAFFDSDGATLGRVDRINNTTMGLTDKTLFDFTTINNTAPTLDLNGTGTGGTGNTVTLTGAASGLVDATATVGDTENDSANWNGATLTVKRTATAGTANGVWSSDQFGFTVASGITIDSGDLKSGSTTIGTVTNTGGTLTITFNTSASTALVTDVVKGVTYANSAPAGNATVTVTLTDGSGGSTSADVTVTSSSINVTTTTDTATVDVTDGISFSEALAIANTQSGADTLIIGSGFTGAMALAGNLTLSESLAVNADAADGWIIQDGTKTITLDTGTTLTFTNSSGTVTINPMLAGAGGLIKSGAGTLTLAGTNTYSAATAVTGGTLSISAATNIGAGAITLDGGTLANTGSTVSLSNDVALGSGGGTVGVDSGNALTLSGVLSGSGALAKSLAGTLTLSGTNTYTGTTAISAGTLVVTGTLNGSAAGTVTIGSGTTLSGTGTVNGGVSVATGGTLSPGIAGTNSGVGTLTIASGGLTIASGGTLAADIAGASSYDVVTVTGTVTVTGATLSLGGSHVATRTASGQSFLLITNDSTDAITGTFSGLTGGSTTSFNGANLTASYAAGTDTNDFRLLGPSNDLPVLAGTFTTAGAINDSATASPFSAVTFTDADDSTGTFTVTITYTGANGTLASGGGGLTGTAGSYTLTASTPSALQTLLQALVFTPTNNQVTPGGTVGTTFTLTPNDGTSDGSSNATTVYTVTSMNDTPASLALSDAAVSTWNSANMTVGTLSATDPDTGQTLTYTLVSGAGDDNNPSFNINGTALRATDPSLLTTGTYSVRVRVSDGTASVEQSFSITVDSNLYVTTGDNTDTTGTGNQNINGDYAADLADGGGLSLFEARYYTRFGGTITFNLSSGTSVDMAGLSMDLGNSSNSVVFDTDRMSTLTISNGTLVALSGLTVTNGASDMVTISALISGNGSVTKSGAGTLVLSGTNSYTGSTAVSAGTMLVTGTLTGGGTVSVVSGATLGGTGSITTSGTGVTIADGAILAPGVAGTNNGIGKLTIDGNLRLTGALAVEAGSSGGVGGTDFDQVAVNGTVSLNGGSVSFSRVNSYVATNGTVFRVIDNDNTDAIGGSPGTFGSIAEGATTASNSDYYSVSYSAGTGNDVILTSAANPTVSSVSSTTADGTYKAGDSIAITVTFSRSVTVTGTPTLSLGTGRTASYSGGSGTSTLTFTYTVQAGDNAADLDYASTTALSGTIADAASNAATLTLATPGASGSLGANKAIIIDTTAPGTPPVPVLSAGSDSGSSNSDGITNITTPILTGTAEAASTVTLYDTDGTTVIGTGTANGSGNYSITVSALSAGVHSITAKATDAGGNVSAASTGLSVSIDTGVPTVSSVSSTTTDGTYNAGDSIAITVAFSEAVMVTGTPTLSLGTGQTASYSGGSGTNTLTFTYTVQAGDTAADLDYASTTALSGTIADGAGNAATLTLATPGANGSLGANKAIIIDTGAPTVSSVSSTTADGTYKAGDSIAITVAFSEAVTVTGTPTLSLGTGRTASYSGGSGTSTLTFTYTVQAGDSAADLDYASTTALSGTIADAASNAATLTMATPGASGSLGANKAIIIDTGAPTVSSVSSTTADGTYTTGDSIAITVAFSEAVTVTGTPTLSLGTGRTASYSGGSGTNTLTFTYTVQAGDSAADLDYASTTALLGTIADAASNAATLTLATPGASGSLGAAKAIIIDTGAPLKPSAPMLSAGSDSGSSNSDGITNITTPILTGTAEAASTVTLYDTDGTTVIGTGTADGSGNYSITVSALSAGAHSITAKATDAGGNVSTASAGLSVTIDAGAPTVSSVSSTNADGTYKIGDSIAITIDFSEAVMVTGTPTLSLGTGQTASYSGGSGTSTLTFVYNVQAGDSAADLDYASTTALSGTIMDSTGNVATLTLATPGTGGSLGAANNIVIDTGAPLTPSAPMLGVGSDSGSSSSDGITSITTPTLTGMAEAGGKVTLYDTDGTTVLGTGTADGSGSYSITVSPLSVGAHSITARATDAGGNVSAASTGLSVTIDTGAPTVSSVSSTTADGTYKAGDSIAITVAFSEAVTVTGTPTLSLGTGREASYSGGSGTSTLTFTYTVQAGDRTADLDYASTAALSGAITDTAGNAATLTLAAPGAGGSLGASNDIVIDTTGPVVTSVSVPPDAIYRAGQTMDFTVTFSKMVSVDGMPVLPITLDNGEVVQAAYVSGSGGTALTFRYIVGTGRLDSNGIVLAAALSGGAIRDAAGNNAALVLNGVAGTGGVHIDSLLPTVSSVTAVTADGVYTTGDTITLQVHFSETVTVSGTPSLTLNTGQTARYSGGSGTSTLTFTYDVQTGDNSADLDASGSGALSGSITDTAGNGAVLTLPTPGAANSLGGDSNIVIDTAPPAVRSVVVPPDGLYKAGETLTLLVQVSEAVTVRDGTPSILLDIGGVSRQAVYSAANNTGLVLRFDYVVQAGDSDLDGISVGALSLNGATIADANRLALTNLANVPGTQGVRIDTPVDTVAPPAPASLALAAGSDTGSSGSDRVTNIDRPTLTGTAEAGATVTILVDGVRSGTATAGFDGAWSVTLPTALANGVRTITTTATDAAGNTSPASAALVLTVDKTAPVLTVPGLGPGSDSGASASDRITNVTRPTLTGTTEAGSTVGIVLDGNMIGTTTAGADGTWNFTIGTGLAEGDHSVQATSTDLAGNIGRSASQTFTIRSMAPATPPVPVLLAASDSGASADDRLTNVTRPTVTGTAIANGTVTVLVDGTAIGTVQADASGAWSLTPDSALSVGAHQVQVRVTDVAGNSSLPSDALVLTVDTGPPTIGAGTAPSSLSAGSTVAIGAGMVLSDTSTLDRLTVTLTNAQSGDELVTGTLPSGITATRDGSRVILAGVASAADYQAALQTIGLRSSATDPAFGGTVSSRSITVSARDAAGNESTLVTVTVPVSNSVTVPPPTTTLPPVAGNGPSTNNSSAGTSGNTSTSAAGGGSSGVPSLPGDGVVDNGDTGRSVTLGSDGGGTAGNDDGRSVTLSSVGGSTASSDAGRSVTLSSVGGQSEDGFSSSSSGLSGGTGSTGSSGGTSLDGMLGGDVGSTGQARPSGMGTQGFGTPGATTSSVPSDQGPRRKPGSPAAGAGQDGNRPDSQSQEQNQPQSQPESQPDGAPADNPDGDQKPTEGTPDGNAPPQGRGNGDRAAAVPAERSAPGFAQQVARAHGSPVHASALLAALANHVLPGNRAA